MRDSWPMRLKLTVAAIGLAVVLLLSAVLVSPRLAETAEGDDALGMMLIDIQSDDTAMMYHVDALGVYVLAVDCDSSAYDAGVRSGDRIVSANGQPVSNTTELTELLTAASPLELTLARGTKQIGLTLDLAGD